MKTERMCYVAEDPKQPGTAWAACIDDAKFIKETAKDIAEWVKEGAIVKRVTPAVAREMMMAWKRKDA